MYIIHCQNCSEDIKTHDRMRSKTIRCHICCAVVQVGDVKREVVKNINRIDNHEERITDIEQKPPASQILMPVWSPPVQYVHAPQCCCPVCMNNAMWALAVFVVLVIIGIAVGIVVWIAC